MAAAAAFGGEKPALRPKVCPTPVRAEIAMQVCWFPETAEWQVERLIRLSGAYKMNYVVLEPWGTFDSKVIPQRRGGSSQPPPLKTKGFRDSGAFGKIRA